MNTLAPSSAKETILGYSIDRSIEVMEDINRWIETGDTLRWLACINPHSYAVALEHPAFATALREADWLIPDGVGIVMASRFLKGSIRQRVTGSDLFEAVSRYLDRVGGKSVFFLGATSETLETIRQKMAKDYPNIHIAGTYSPPFMPEYTATENAAMVEAINTSRADVLWVGLTSPKQDLWIHTHRNQLQVKFAAGIGAVFDFYTGRVKRTPKIFRQLGLEWLPRLVQQPKRLWRRMGVSAPVFVWHVVKERKNQII